MSVRKLKKGGFVPTRVVERMSKTLPGVLADFLDHYLYGMLEEGDKHLKTERKIFAKLPENATSHPGMDEGGNYADVQRTLREIRDYLEGCAFREVLDK